MITLEKYTGVNIAKIKSLEIILASFVNYIPDPDEDHVVNFWDIEFDAPDLFEKIEFTKDTCSFTEPQSDSDSGEIFKPEIKCQVPKNRKEATAFFRKFNGMFIYALIKDMNDNALLFGKVKLTKKREIQGSVSGKNIYDIEISGETTQEAVFLDYTIPDSYEWDDIYSETSICIMTNYALSIDFDIAITTTPHVYTIEHNENSEDWSVDESGSYTKSFPGQAGSYVKISENDNFELNKIESISAAGMGINRFYFTSRLNICDIDLSNNNLPADDINRILTRINEMVNVSGTTNGNINLSGGNNAEPSSEAITAINNLVNNYNWTVSVNGYNPEVPG